MQASALTAAEAVSDAYKTVAVALEEVRPELPDDPDLAGDDRVWDIVNSIRHATAELASMYRYLSMLDPSTPSVNGSDSLTSMPSDPQPAPNPDNPDPDPGPGD